MSNCFFILFVSNAKISILCYFSARIEIFNVLSSNVANALTNIKNSFKVCANDFKLSSIKRCFCLFQNTYQACSS